MEITGKNQRYRHFAWGLLALLLSPQLHADTLTIYAAQGMDTNLLDFPKRALTRNLTFEESYLVAVGYLLPTQTPRPITALGNLLGASYVNSGIEFVGGKHFGLQHNFETDIAYALQLPPLRIAPISMRFGVSLGLSYAWGTPSYEDGPHDDPERRYRFQNFNAYELEWQHVDHPSLSVVTRIHHRSGIYGLVAPPHVGSNFLALGLRYTY